MSRSIAHCIHVLKNELQLMMGHVKRNSIIHIHTLHFNEGLLLGVYMKMMMMKVKLRVHIAGHCTKLEHKER